MSPTAARSALKVRPGLIAVAVLAAVFAVDLDLDAVRSRIRPSSADVSQPPAALHVGQIVRLRFDGLDYEVIATGPDTALIRRGEEEIYADRSDLLVDR